MCVQVLELQSPNCGHAVWIPRPLATYRLGVLDEPFVVVHKEEVGKSQRFCADEPRRLADCECQAVYSSYDFPGIGFVGRQPRCAAGSVEQVQGGFVRQAPELLVVRCKRGSYPLVLARDEN